MEALLGIPRWSLQLMRPACSVLREVCLHVDHTDHDIAVPLADAVRAEIVAVCFLLIFLEVDFARPWSPFLVATDASPSKTT